MRICTLIFAALLLLSAAPSFADALVSLDMSTIGKGNAPVTDEIATSAAPDIQLIGRFSETRNGGRTIVLSGGVTAFWDAITLTAATVVYDRESQEIYAEGSVVVTHPYFRLVCEKLWLDFDDEIGYATKCTVYSTLLEYEQMDDLVLAFKSENMGRLESGELVALDNRIATSTFEPPSWYILVSIVRINLSGAVSSDPGVVKLGGISVFYLPRISLGSGGSGGQPLKISFGSTSYLGIFLRVQVRAFTYSGITNYVLTDYFTERGLGLGTLSTYNKNGHAGRLRTYFIEDGNDGLYDETRYQLELAHRTELELGDFLDEVTVTAELHRRSDRLIERDFFRYEWYVEKDPESYVNLQQTWDNSSVSLLNRFRVNNYEDYVNYTPEVSYALYGLKTGPGVLRLQVGAGHLERKDGAHGYEPEAERFWLDPVVEFPVNLSNKFVLVPWLGASGRYYSDAALGRELENGRAEAGVAFSTRLASPPFGGDETRKFRHVFIPRIEFKATTKPSADPTEIEVFDTLDVLYEERSVNFVLINAIEMKTITDGRTEYSDRFLLRLENRIYDNCSARTYENNGNAAGPLNAAFRLSLDKFFVIGDFDYDWYLHAMPTAGTRFGLNMTDRLSLEWGFRFIRDNPWFLNYETTDVSVTVQWYPAKKWYYILEYSRIFSPGYSGDFEDASLTVVRRGADFTAAVTIGNDNDGGYFFFGFYPNFAYTINTRLKPQNFR